MARSIPIRQFAEKLGYAYEPFRRLVVAGKVPGARRRGGRWVVAPSLFNRAMGFDRRGAYALWRVLEVLRRKGSTYPDQRIRAFVRYGAFPGSRKLGRLWLIPNSKLTVNCMNEILERTNGSLQVKGGEIRLNRSWLKEM